MLLYVTALFFDPSNSQSTAIDLIELSYPEEVSQFPYKVIPRGTKKTWNFLPISTQTLLRNLLPGLGEK
jgi:hypothetical protein